jgi:CubicO group peptidase (beta-lactamase class C family)
MAALLPLPPQPPGVPWPTASWPEAPPGPDVDAARVRAVADVAFDPAAKESHGETLALLAVHRGCLVLERYASGKGPADVFPSWSVAKSMLHAVTGVLVAEGRVDLHAPAPVPAWRGAGDPRGAITLEHLLRMVDGLDFVELYETTGRSDVVDMLFRSGKDDVAAYASARPLAHPPGTWWSYSSGTSNVIAGIAGRTVGGGEHGMAAFLRRVLFGPIGMASAAPRFDRAGTFIGSSYVFATARDFARFGLLYLRDGWWDGVRVLPPGWVDHARTETPASIGRYGAHWWLALDGTGIFSANGFQGQYVVVDPRRDLVLVRLGVSTPEQRVPVVHDLRALVDAFPPLGGTHAPRERAAG